MLYSNENVIRRTLQERTVIFGWGFAGKTNLKLYLKTLLENNSLNKSTFIDLVDPKFSNPDQTIYDDLEKLKQEFPQMNISSFSNEDEYYQVIDNDISRIHTVLICCNTKFHFSVINTLLSKAAPFKDARLPRLLIEKPFVETSEQAKNLMQQFEELAINYSFFYQYRYSAAADALLDALKETQAPITSLSLLSQKDRADKGPHRPSAGVIIDEYTHYDNFLAWILKECGFETIHFDIIIDDNDSYILDDMKIVGASTDLQKQEYGHAAPNAEMKVKLKLQLKSLNSSSAPIFADELELDIFVSFIKAPQQRQIILKNSHSEFKVTFDSPDNFHDIFTVSTPENDTTENPFEVNKKLTACEHFFTYGDDLAKDPKHTDLAEVLRSQQLIEQLLHDLPRANEFDLESQDTEDFTLTEETTKPASSPAKMLGGF